MNNYFYNNIDALRDNLTYQIENRRYMGSKAKLASWIFELISKKCEGKCFADMFAGTGIISSVASKSFQEVIVNDFLYSNNVIYNGFFGKGNWNKNKIKDIIRAYTKIPNKKIRDTFFSKNYGGKYFGIEDAKKIGYIRDDIEKNKPNLTKREYSILIASLIYSVDKIANTVGHYDAYMRVNSRDNRFIFGIINPIKKNKGFKIFSEDANNLAKKIRADVVYIDPPYNSRQYSRFYHVLETLTKWDNPTLYGTALKPAPENTSDYCKTTAPEAFQDLIGSLNCKYIVVSYNNTYKSKSHSSQNKITLNQIEMTLKERGDTEVYEKDYKAFNCGKTEFDNHKELVFITKVG
jgi:adenine-specific DNA-methyltransferase